MTLLGHCIQSQYWEWRGATLHKILFQDSFIQNLPLSPVVLIFPIIFWGIKPSKILFSGKISLPGYKGNIREQKPRPLPYGGLSDLAQDLLCLYYSWSGIEQGGIGRNPWTSSKMADSATYCGYTQVDGPDFGKSHFSYLSQI